MILNLTISSAGPCGIRDDDDAGWEEVDEDDDDTDAPSLDDTPKDGDGAGVDADDATCPPSANITRVGGVDSAGNTG